MNISLDLTWAAAATIISILSGIVGLWLKARYDKKQENFEVKADKIELEQKRLVGDANKLHKITDDLSDQTDKLDKRVNDVEHDFRRLEDALAELKITIKEHAEHNKENINGVREKVDELIALLLKLLSDK